MYVPAPFEVEQPKPQPAPPRKVHQHRDNEPVQGETLYRADYEERAGSVVILRGSAEVEKPECILKADEIHYDEDTGLAEARGHVHYTNYDTQEELFADRADYDMVAEKGSFYVVNGSAPGHTVQRPGLLTTTEPIRFQGEWAERIEDRYVLYQGTLTNCPPGTSWWQLISPRMVIIPDDHALAYKALIRLRGVPSVLGAGVLQVAGERRPPKRVPVAEHREQQHARADVRPGLFLGDQPQLPTDVPPGVLLRPRPREHGRFRGPAHRDQQGQRLFLRRGRQGIAGAGRGAAEARRVYVRASAERGPIWGTAGTREASSTT